MHPATRWLWLNFHVAVWISIAYAAGITVEQHVPY